MNSKLRMMRARFTKCLKKQEFSEMKRACTVECVNYFDNQVNIPATLL